MNTEQLVLPLTRDENYLKAYFEKSISKVISLKITDNSTSMLSVKTGRSNVSVRLHRIFLNAGDAVIKEIALLIKNRKIKTPLIKDFIKQNRDFLKERPPKKLNMKTQGKFYNLLDIYGSINKEYFKGMVSATITWGAKSPRYAVRKRTLGSYSSHTNTIRINPILDKKTVPRYFVEFIVYHEMLHADMGVESKNGRRSVHSKEFKRRERLLRDYERAVAWEKGREDLRDAKLYIEGFIPVSVSLAKPGFRYFLLRAKGDSMNKAKINDGDLILVRRQSSAQNGDIVVALIDNEATVKEFQHNKNCVVLMPRSNNKKHKPIILTENFQVQGVAVTTIPNLEV